MFNQLRSLFTNSVKAYVEFFERYAEGIESTLDPDKVRGAVGVAGAPEAAAPAGADGRTPGAVRRGQTKKISAISRIRSTAVSTGCCRGRVDAAAFLARMVVEGDGYKFAPSQAGLVKAVLGVVDQL